MTYRMRNILIAVGLALAAALLTVFYVSNYKSSVKSEEQTINVLVAARDIPVGTLGSQVASEHMLATQEVPRKAIVAGTISKPEELSGLIATQPVYIGEQVTARRFGPIAEAGVRTQLKGTYRAIRLQGNPNQLLTGTLRPGDHVDVVASVMFPTEDSGKHFTKVVLRDVLANRRGRGQESVVLPAWRSPRSATRASRGLPSHSSSIASGVEANPVPQPVTGPSHRDARASVRWNSRCPTLRPPVLRH